MKEGNSGKVLQSTSVKGSWGIAKAQETTILLTSTSFGLTRQWTYI